MLGCYLYEDVFYLDPNRQTSMQMGVGSFDPIPRERFVMIHYDRQRWKGLIWFTVCLTKIEGFDMVHCIRLRRKNYLH